MNVKLKIVLFLGVVLIAAYLSYSHINKLIVSRIDSSLNSLEIAVQLIETQNNLIISQKALIKQLRQKQPMIF